MIRRDSTKTDAGARVIPLNRDAVLALSDLLRRAEMLGASEPDISSSLPASALSTQRSP
jgi:hypothetical protein